MKKLGLLFMAGVVAFGMSSCSSDDEEEVKPTPKFDFITDAGYTSANVTVDAGSLVKIGIDASGSENLESVGVRTQVGSAQESIFPLTSTGDSIITSLKTKDFTFEFEYQAGQLPTNERITVIVKMSNGTQTSKSIVLTVTAPTKPVTEALSRQMGAQNNLDFGSYFSVSENISKLGAEANANPAVIDFVYYYSGSNLATLAAPSTNGLGDIVGNSSLDNWDPKNKTLFKKVSGFDYDNLTESGQLSTEIAKGGLTNQATNLVAGDIVIFVTEGAQTFGAIKVVSVTPASGSGVLTFDMKFVAE